MSAVAVKAAVQNYIRSHASSGLLSLVASYCEKFLRAYYNEDFYEFVRNGEAALIKTISEFLKDEDFSDI